MSTGVIGGADGPTAIYVASSVNWELLAGIVIIIAVSIISFLVWKKKQQQK